MALTTCPDCGREVSTNATACPGCGYPVQAQTIEATGKKWKGLQALGAVLWILSIGPCVVGADSGSDDTVMLGVIMGTIGFLVFVSARIGAWWGHG